MSRVNSSCPSLVSRTTAVNSSMWIEVYLSAWMRLSLTMIASSKLYPSQIMKAASTFRPRLNSPWQVAAPSAMTCPAATESPSRTIGRWLRQVLSLSRTYLRSGWIDRRRSAVIRARPFDDRDVRRVHFRDRAFLLRDDHHAGTAGDGAFHAGDDQRALGSAGAERPAAACSIPSARGSRRCARGTGSGWPRRRRSAAARHPRDGCRPAALRGTRRRRGRRS